MRSSTTNYLVLAWSNLNGEDIAFVGDFEDLCPDEAIESHAVPVDDKSGGADSNVHQLAVDVLPTNIPQPCAVARAAMRRGVHVVVSGVRAPLVLGWVTVCGVSPHVTSQLSQLSLASLRGREIEQRLCWGKGGNVTSAV